MVKGMLSDRASGYQQQGFVPTSPASSPTSSTATSRCCRPCCCGPKQKHDHRAWPCCCCYCPSSSTPFITSFGAFILVLGYTLLGAFLFMALEGGFNPRSTLDAAGFDPGPPTPPERLLTSEEIRSQTVEKLWSITEDLNILYKENWTRLAAQEVYKFQENLVRSLKQYGGSLTVKNGGSPGGAAVYYTHHHHHWTFTSSFFYSLTLITTIGYGSIAPRTAWGKLATIVYAVIGIPIMLVYLTMTGEILSRHFCNLYTKIFCVKTKKKKRNKTKKGHKNETTYLNATYGHKGQNNIGLADGKIPFTTGTTEDLLKVDIHARKNYQNYQPHRHHVNVPILFCLVFIALYICGGAYLFHYIENWTYLESSFFCFTSLGTIGFGDLMPGLRYTLNLAKKSSVAGEVVSVTVFSTYILFGLALIAMCFSLVQEQIIYNLKRVNKFFGVMDEGPEEKDELEGISMSIVSSTTS